MPQATETIALGAEQVTVVIEFDLSSTWLISGDFAGTIPSGQVGFINGDVNLTGDLIVEGLLTGIDTFTLTGNGFQLLVQNGGQLNLQGVERSGWVPWGDTPVGWVAGDAVSIAPTAAGFYSPTAVNWPGWSLARPTRSPDVLLPNGVVVRPEVLNRTRSIVLHNLRRIHFHDGAGVQILKWVKVVGCGQVGILTQYPIHFHLCGESVRGSLLEGVLIESGKNHAFVVHGSHGVTLRDCTALDTIDDAFWWDLPVNGNTVNNSNDTVYDHCMAMYVTPSIPDNRFRLAAFMLGAGLGNSIKHSVACCVQGTTDASGFHWPEQVNGNPGGTLWKYHHNTFHNNKVDGIFVWQNDFSPHVIEDFIGYHNGQSQIDHGAYENVYHYRQGVLKGGAEGAFKLHAVDNIILEDIVSDRPLRLMKHRIPATTFTVVRRCSFSQYQYTETGDSGIEPSKIRYEDCPNLTPASFSMADAISSSIAEIYQAGVLIHRWTQRVWT